MAISGRSRTLADPAAVHENTGTRFKSKYDGVAMLESCFMVTGQLTTHISVHASAKITTDVAYHLYDTMCHQLQ